MPRLTAVNGTRGWHMAPDAVIMWGKRLAAAQNIIGFWLNRRQKETHASEAVFIFAVYQCILLTSHVIYVQPMPANAITPEHSCCSLQTHGSHSTLHFSSPSSPILCHEHLIYTLFAPSLSVFLSACISISSCIHGPTNQNLMWLPWHRVLTKICDW